jgi:RNA polymerase sigma factor (sigma-70 family)
MRCLEKEVTDYGKRQTEQTDFSVVDDDLLARIELALSKLPRREREIFLAVRFDDMNCVEIAQRTGLRVAVVERALARAILRLDISLSGPRR